MKLAVTAQGKDLDAALDRALADVSTLSSSIWTQENTKRSSINMRLKLAVQAFKAPSFSQITGSMSL